MRKFYIGFLGLVSLFISFSSLAQTSTVYLTVSGGSFSTEKWVSITDGPNGTGNVIWDQDAGQGGGGVYGNGAGLLTDMPIVINDGQTYYINCYDRYADSWDGTTYELRDAISGGGLLIANNGGVSPDDGNDNDVSSSWGDTQADELESSESFSYTPPACTQPNSLTATNVTATSADLDWTEGGTATMWNVEYGPTGFTPGTGTMVNGVTSKPLNISSLSPSTSYDFYVQADCGGSTSNQTGPSSFTTNCVTLTAPWAESFDNTTIPTCWSMSGPENWLFTTSWMDYGAAGVNDHTGNGGSAAGVDGSGGTNSGVELYSPMIDVSGLAQPTLDFYYFSNNTDNPTEFNSLIVDVWDGASWIRLDSIAHHDANWQNKIYYLNGFMTVTGDIQVRFTVDQTSNTGSAFYNDQLIDDVSIYDGPTCPNPTNLTASWVDNDSVIMTWNAGFMETSWNIQLGAAGFMPGTGAEIYANSISGTPTDTIGGLTQVTNYDVYVQADCGSGDTSTWVGPFSFTSLPNCTAPTSFTALYINGDSASVSWTAGGSETEWVVEYGMSGYTPGTGTQTTVLNNTFDTITGLNSGTFYDFYLVSVCSVNDTSLWVGPSSIFTPITNDDACSAITVPVDGVTYNYSNIGATTATNESANTYAYNNSAWFEFVYPTNTLGVNIATCGSSFDTKLAAYTLTDCADFTTYTSLATNDDDCGLQSQIQICANAGDTILVQVGSFSSSSSEQGDIQLTLSGIMDGIDSSATVCSVDTVNLNQISVISNNLGNWTFSDNPSAIVDDSLFNSNVVPAGQHVIEYIVSSGCIEDTTTATITIVSPTSTGTAISPFNACNANVSLFEGLTGTVDMGGTWNDDTGTGLLVGNTFVAFDAPAGTYPFTYTVSNGVCVPSSTTVNVTIEDCTGLEENGMSFDVYPNPSNGEIFISNNGNKEIITIEVIDLQGRVVFNNQINLNSGSTSSVSLDELNSGMYTIRLITAEASATRSIIIE